VPIFILAQISSHKKMHIFLKKMTSFRLKVILYSYLILKKMNERIIDS